MMITSPLFRSVVLAAVAFCATSVLPAQTDAGPKLDFPAASPGSTLKQRVGVTDIEVVYSRPSMKGRKVFGGLVPFGQVWRTGANSATKIVFSTPVKLEGTSIPAGTYGLYTIPGEKEWTIIINNDSAQWGAYSYKPESDVARVKVAAETLTSSVESFTIEVGDLRNDSATLTLAWENTRVPVKISVDLVATLVPQIEAAMASANPKKPYAQAAMFYLENKLDLKKAAMWMDAALAADPKAFYLVYRKGLILQALGDKAGALAAAEASLAAAKQAGGAIGAEYTGLNERLIASLK